MKDKVDVLTFAGPVIIDIAVYVYCASSAARAFAAAAPCAARCVCGAWRGLVRGFA